MAMSRDDNEIMTSPMKEKNDNETKCQRNKTTMKTNHLQ